MNEIDRIEQEFAVIGADADALRTGGAAAGEVISKLFAVAADKEQSKKDAAKSKEQEAKAAQARSARLEASIVASKAAAEPSNLVLQETALRADAKARELEAAAGQSSLMPYGAGGMQSASGASWFSKMSGPLNNGSWLAVGIGSVAVIGLGVYLVKRR